MKVLKMLDKKTLMIDGPGVDKLAIGEMVVILGVGKPIPELGGLPVVVPKAYVEVTLNAGVYAIAASPEKEQEFNPLEGLTFRPRMVRTREPLNVDEKNLIGNPALKPITEGDPAVPERELTSFVKNLAEQLKWREPSQ